MAKLPIPKMPAGFKYNPSKLPSVSNKRIDVQSTLSAASKRISRSSNPVAKPTVSRTPSRSSYSQADRESYMTSKRANKVRGREESARIAKGRDKEASTLLSNPASGTVDDMVSRNRALGREERAGARARKSAPRVQGSEATSSRTSRKSAESSAKSRRINLGETVGDGTFAGQASGSLRMARENFSTGMADRGGAASYLGRAAVQGAVWGGGIGGTVSAAQGGDFWAGAKEGAFKGAVGVAGFKGLRAASGTTSTGFKSIGDTAANSKAVWQHHGKGNVSKSVDSIQRLNADAAKVVKR